MKAKKTNPTFSQKKDKFNKIPVEVKVHDFNNSDLRQLNRYIKAFNCKEGIAIAPKVKEGVVIPQNISFVKFGAEDVKEIERRTPLRDVILARSQEFY